MRSSWKIPEISPLTMQYVVSFVITLLCSQAPCVTGHVSVEGCSAFWSANLRNTGTGWRQRAVLWVCDYVWSEERVWWGQLLGTAIYTHTLLQRDREWSLFVLSGQITFPQSAVSWSYDYIYYKHELGLNISTIQKYNWHISNSCLLYLMML